MKRSRKELKREIKRLKRDAIADHATIEELTEMLRAHMLHAKRESRAVYSDPIDVIVHNVMINEDEGVKSLNLIAVADGPFPLDFRPGKYSLSMIESP